MTKLELEDFESEREGDWMRSPPSFEFTRTHVGITLVIDSFWSIFFSQWILKASATLISLCLDTSLGVIRSFMDWDPILSIFFFRCTFSFRTLELYFLISFLFLSTIANLYFFFSNSLSCFSFSFFWISKNFWVFWEGWLLVLSAELCRDWEVAEDIELLHLLLDECDSLLFSSQWLSWIVSRPGLS